MRLPLAWRHLARTLVLACTITAPGLAIALETSLKAPGAPPDLTERIRSASSVLNAKTRGLDTPIELLSAALSDYRTLVQILYDAGYFSPVVNIRIDGREAAGLDPLQVPGRIDAIEIELQTGPSFRFGTARIGPLAPDTELPGGFAPGQPANTGVIRDAVAAGLQGWRASGHAKAGPGAQRITARHASARLDAEIQLLPGNRLTFGNLHVRGKTAVSEDAIRRIAGFPTGKVYDPDEVQKVVTRLRRTGTFNVVTLRERDTPNPDQSLDFEAEFEDQPPRRITFGVELSSREGLDISTTWMHRNLLGRAERLQFEAAIRNIGGSEDIDGRFGLRLNRPDRLGPDDMVFNLIDLERKNRTHYELTRGTAGIGARRTYSDELFAEAYFGYTHAEANDAFGIGRPFRYLQLPFRVEWDRRDNKVNATKGFFLDGQLTPFWGLSGTDSGAHLKLDGRGYWDLSSSGSLVLAGRVQLGSVVGPSLSNASPELLFYSGGAGSVRGQPFESLGIPIGSGIAGGRSFLGLSAEIRGRVTDKISVVGFYDYGAVDSASFVGSDAESHSGAGLGLRYDLGGFGPLRVDLAYPVSGTTEDGFQFYVGIGQAF